MKIATKKPAAVASLVGNLPNGNQLYAVTFLRTATAHVEVNASGCIQGMTNLSALGLRNASAAIAASRAGVR